MAKCPGSVGGLHSDADFEGLCEWCSRKIDEPVEKPQPETGEDGLEDAYRYRYDPDYGES